MKTTNMLSQEFLSGEQLEIHNIKLNIALGLPSAASFRTTFCKFPLKPKKNNIISTFVLTKFMQLMHLSMSNSSEMLGDRPFDFQGEGRVSFYIAELAGKCAPT